MKRADFERLSKLFTHGIYPHLIFRVVSYCESRGWQRIYDKNRLDYKLKWCETKSPATYYNFKTGDPHFLTPSWL